LREEPGNKSGASMYRRHIKGLGCQMRAVPHACSANAEESYTDASASIKALQLLADYLGTLSPVKRRFRA
jgi:hypothetical protein